MNNKRIEDVLAHYGVLGMHWGVTKSPDSTRVRAMGSKPISALSTEELKTATQRLDLERRYKDLNPSAVTRGSKAVGNALKGLGKLAATVGTITALAAAGQKAYSFYKSTH